MIDVNINVKGSVGIDFVEAAWFQFSLLESFIANYTSLYHFT